MHCQSLNPCRVSSSPSFSLSSSISSSRPLFSLSFSFVLSLLSLSLSFVLSSLSFSFSLCLLSLLSPSQSFSVFFLSLGVVCHVVLCCVLGCGVVCGVWLCPSKTSLCVPAPRAHVETHVRVVPVHTETCRMDTREGVRVGRRESSSASCFSSVKQVNV